MTMRSLAGDQRGFTIVEVMVAVMLLVVGVLGTISLVDVSNAKTNESKGREGATNLAREVVEGARTIGYQQLQPASIKAQLQAMPGLANSGLDWTVKRRGFAYTVEVKVCSVDDPKDGYGSHAGTTFCTDSSTAGSADAQAEDSKRATVDITWKSFSKTRTLRQVALIASDGAAGPPVTSLVATPPSVMAETAAPVIASSITSVSFKATVPAGVSSVVYSLDGVDKGNATVAANGTDWTFSLPISTLTDGGYDVSVRTVDARGVAGPSFAIPLKLIRSQPLAPAGLVGGPNRIFVNGAAQTVIELEWRANSERNVIGYRVYNANSALVCPANMQTIDSKLSCIDFAATGGTYSVVALYRDAGGIVREGPASTVSAISSSLRTYYFTQTTGNTADGSKCQNVPRKRDMEIGYAGSGSEEIAAGKVDNFLNFCSPAFGGAETIPAGTTTMSGYISNTDKNPCNLTVSLKKNGTTLLGQATLNLPGLAGATPTLRTWTFSNSSTTLALGDRLNLHMDWLDSGAGCDHTTMHWGGTTNRSSVSMPSGVTSPPSPPTGLSATTEVDGTTRLSWSAPTSGSPAVSFYRIYRDGQNYTNRYDTTGSATDTTYVDDPGGASHTYHVTAVSANLAESVMAGPVTK